ncbi:MAG: prephenate dehydratase, partial [Clostridia bacterium]|nr:prephenate dehydratase [Clostridia bacterium]
MEKTGYLGPEGSYSHIAAKLMRPCDDLKAYASFPLVFSALVSGEVESIVVPIENTLNGGVLQNIDLL